MQIPFTALSACVKADPCFVRPFSWRLRNLSLLYALFYCDNKNGLAKRFVVINQSNIFKRALIFFALYRILSRVGNLIRFVPRFRTCRKVCMFMLPMQVCVVTGSRKPHFMPHKSLSLILRTCTHQNLENSGNIFQK